MRIFKLASKPKIVTSRLRLEVLKPTQKKLRELEALVHDPEVRAEWEASGLWRKNLVPYLAKEWPLGARNWRGRRDRFLRADLVMIERKTSRLIGHMPISWNADDQSLEIGYFILSEKRKLGLTSEAVRGVIEWSQNFPQPVVVYSWAAEKNRASRALLKSLGFEASAKCSIDGRIQRCYHFLA